MKKTLILTFISMVLTTSVEAQLLKKLKTVSDKLTTNLSLSKLQRDPITTSFKDVDITRYLPDDFGDDEAYKSLHDQPYLFDKGFYLNPGFYEGNLTSFCIKAGTYAPRQGNGRYYAELKGSRASIIESVLEGYQKDPDIKRIDVQMLLWAIISKTDIDKMRGTAKQVALKVLSPKQILKLSASSLEQLAENELRKLAYEDETLKYIVEAENKMRNLYYQGVKTFQDYEKMAMRAGLEPFSEEFNENRWIRHPDGFFIRFKVKSYSNTTVQVYVPAVETNFSKSSKQNWDANYPEFLSMAGVYFLPRNSLAIPSNSSAQRLIITDVPYGEDSWGGSSPGNSDDDDTIVGSSDGAILDEIWPEEFGENQSLDIVCEEIVHKGIDATIKEEMILQNIPGIAVGVFQNGKMVHLKGYGYQDIINKKPIEINTVMRWASISKSVTALAAFQLEQDPSLDFSIDDLVTKHSSYWPDKVDYCESYPIECEPNERIIDSRHGRITIKQLLQNNSGIQHYGKGFRDSTSIDFIRGNDTLDLEFLNTYPKSYRKDSDGFAASSSVRMFNKSVLAFDPGKEYLYSSFGFTLAGAAMEEASPSGYVDWVLKRIAQPAKMDSFKVGNGDKRPGHQMSEDGIFKVTLDGSKESILPGGGWESNICDLARYAINLASDAFYAVSNHPRGRIWEGTGAVNNADYKYGIKGILRQGEQAVTHDGLGANSTSNMLFFPSDSTGVVFLCSADYIHRDRVMARIFEALGAHTNYFPNYPASPKDDCYSARMKSVKDVFMGIWRKTNKDVLIRTGRPHFEFIEEKNRLETSGYFCKKIDPFLHKGRLHWDAVFQKGSAKTELVTELTENAFLKICQDKSKLGYELVDIETYLNWEGKRRWAGIFKGNQEKSEFVRGIDLSGLNTEISKQSGRGMRLVDVEVYEQGNQQYYAALFAPGEPTKFHSATREEFASLITTYRNDGYRLLDREFDEIINKEGLFDWQYLGIWEKSNEEEKTIVANEFCEFTSKHHEWSNENFELIDWDRLELKIEILDNNE